MEKKKSCSICLDQGLSLEEKRKTNEGQVEKKITNGGCCHIKQQKL